MRILLLLFLAMNLFAAKERKVWRKTFGNCTQNLERTAVPVRSIRDFRFEVSATIGHLDSLIGAKNLLEPAVRTRAEEIKSQLTSILTRSRGLMDEEGENGEILKALREEFAFLMPEIQSI